MQAPAFSLRDNRQSDMPGDHEHGSNHRSQDETVDSNHGHSVRGSDHQDHAFGLYGLDLLFDQFDPAVLAASGVTAIIGNRRQASNALRR